MSKTVQLDPMIPVFVVKEDGCEWPEGKAFAIAWIDYSQEHFTLWRCAFDEMGVIYDVPQKFVRLQFNPSMERRFRVSPAMSR